MRRQFIFTALFLLISYHSSGASNSGDPVKRKYFTKKVSSESLVIDGIISDAAWEIVEWSGEFTQRYPTELVSPTYQTKIKIMYDDENLYVAAMMFDDEPEKILSQMSRRDNTTGDMISIIIDSNLDKRTAFRFGVTVSGVKLDEIYTGDGDASDVSWDPVWEVKARIVDDGWTAEMKIPLSQLRFSDESEQIWGINFWRRFHRNDEYDFWNPLAQRIPGLISLSGELHGLFGLNNSRKLEIMPFNNSQFNSKKVGSGNPFTDGKDYFNNFGLNGKVGINGDFTLDFAVNPDFGQVEADPSEMNLTEFETFFAEKRPFFVEGKEIFESNITGNTILGDSKKLFHSRRIGNAPSYIPEAAPGEYVDGADKTTILGSLKFSGKTKNGLSIGIIESITQKESSRINENGKLRDVSSEPLTNYFVGSVLKDFDKGNTIAGAQITAVNRDIDADELKFLNTSAYSGTVDLQKYWNDKKYFISLSGVFSQINGDEEAIQSAQLSSARYFQRVDNEYSDFNPEKTSLRGNGGGFALGKNPSGKWNYNFGMQWYSPGLELNDIGFLPQADMIQEFSSVVYEDVKPNSIYRNLTVIFNQQKDWNFSGDTTNERYNLDIRLSAKNFWNYRISTTRSLDYINTTSLRSGPGILTPGRQSIFASISTNSVKKYSTVIAQYFNNGFDGHEEMHITNFIQRWRPAKNISGSAHAVYQKVRTEMQYVSREFVDNSTKYILGEIDRKTINLTFRLNYSLSPTLTLEYYGQPYISAGKYSKFKEVTNSKAGQYNDRFHMYGNNEISLDDENRYNVDQGTGEGQFSFRNPDFNFKQFRSNFVVRWEYNPGSTIYFVWSQERTGYEHIGEFDLNDNVDSLFNSLPDNVFMIKINKWLSF